MFQVSWGLRPLAAVTAAVVLSATMITTSQAAATAGAAPGSSTAAVAAAERGSVLESAYGEARSKVKGTFGRNGVVSGDFTPRKFVTRNGKLMAVGVLEATLTKASGAVVGTVEKRVKLPVRKIDGQPVGARLAQQQSCQILRLVLGPLDLDLLGLHVHLNRVVLVIEAHPGPGNLLGNLLCAIAGLLDGTGFLTQIRQILNAILAILRI